MEGARFVHRSGRGERLVLIHGGGGTWRQWRPVIPLLEPHRDVLAVNLVGHWGGREPPRGADAGIDLFAEFVESDMEAAGWRDAHVAGTSLGAWVALELAKRGRARTCTALAPAGGWVHGGDLGLRIVALSYRMLQGAARLATRNPGRWVRRPRLRRLLYWHHFARTDRMDPGDTAHMIAGVANCTILPAAIEWARRTDGATGLNRIDCPVQLLFPEKDRVLPYRRYGTRLTSALPHADVHLLPGAGHIATWDSPELVAELILRFTDEAERRRPAPKRRPV
jgi:pimeloyl-ACP methyl ester carboxylesterase